MRRPRPRTRVGPAQPPRAAAHKVELVFLPGLEEIVRDEVAEVLPQVRSVWQVRGRDDAVGFKFTGELRRLLALRTVVAPFILLEFAITNPRQLLAGDFFPAVVDAVRSAASADSRRRPRSLRIDAAGSDSSALTKLATQLSAATGLSHDPADGECVIRIRRSPAGPHWDVLVRLGARPLSARPWRVPGHPAALNATVAAAMIRLSEPDERQRVANLMCGSATLLIERLLVRPASHAIGCDIDPAAVRLAKQNIGAAGLTSRVVLRNNGIEEDEWLSGGPYDVLLADPPWGDKSGRHDTNEELHRTLLRRAAVASRRGSKLVVLTHEVKIMTRCIREASDAWQLSSATRVFQKGHHPRIYLLERT